MLENASNMIYKWKIYSTTTATISKAKQTVETEILTSKTTQATLGLPQALPSSPTQSTATLILPPPLPPPPQSSSPTRISLTSCLNFLIPKDTTSTTSSPSATSLEIVKKATLTNSTPHHLLTTLRRAITTNVKYSENTNRSNNNCSSWSSSNSNNIITNTNVSRHMIQHNDRNDDYHMLSLNHQNCTNVLQHQPKQQQQYKKHQHKNKPQQQCNNNYLQQHKVKRQFLLLLTCYVAIITIFSLPHLSIAAAATATASASASSSISLHMTTTAMSTTPTTTSNTTTNSLTIATHGYPMLSSSSSVSFSNSSNDNNEANNTIVAAAAAAAATDDNVSDNADEPTSFSPLTATIENSIIVARPSRHKDFNIISRFIRSLDGSSGSSGGGSSSSSSIFSPSSGGSGLTNIFNQNLETGLSNNIECPSFDENSACPCYKFEDGLFLECPGTTAISLRTTLERISSPIHSLSIYDFDRSVTSLSQDVFQPGVNIRHLQFSHSHLETLKDNSLKNVRASLESLSIVNGKLTQTSERN